MPFCDTVAAVRRAPPRGLDGKMSEQTFVIEVQEDFLERQAKAPPIQALAELIWNALDAEATRVDVSWEDDFLGGMRSIAVTDNGHGFPRTEAETLFGRLGGSWKRIGAKTKNGQRWLHGHEGRGRFKAFALGRVVEWNIRYRAGDGVRVYSIAMLGDDQRHVRVSDERAFEGSGTGVQATIKEVRTTRFLDRDETRQELAEIFAIYLRTYSSVVLSISSVRLDPSLAIASQRMFDLPDIEAGGSVYRARLDVIEWRGKAVRAGIIPLQ